MNQESLKKLNKANYWKIILKKCPYIRAIFIVGSVGMGNARLESDIDFLIIVKDGRIFMARAILSFVTQIFALRRNNKKVANRFCLNHYLTESNLELPYKNEYDKNLYTNGLKVLFDKDNFYEKFLSANNFGFQKFNFKKSKKYKNYKICDFLEKKLKKWQIKKIRNNPLTKLKKGIIIANNEQMQFHPETKSGIYIRDIE